MNEKTKRYLSLLLAFLAGCLLTGLLFFGRGSSIAGRLDKRYADQYAGAAAIIGQLEDELGRERESSRRLREQNNRARELVDGIADASGRNVRNLQDAVGLVGEIREKLKVLEDFYAGWDPGSGGD